MNNVNEWKVFENLSKEVHYCWLISPFIRNNSKNIQPFHNFCSSKTFTRQKTVGVVFVFRFKKQTVLFPYFFTI